MPITRTDVNQADGLDKIFLMSAILAEMETQELLDNLEEDFATEIDRHTRSNGLAGVDDLKSSLGDLVAAALVLFDTRMGENIQRLAKGAKNKFMEDSLPLLRAAGANDAANTFKRELNNFEQDMEYRFRHTKSGKYDLTYLDRMEAIEQSTTRVVRSIVDLGVKEGKSVEQIKQELLRYVQPRDGHYTRPYEIIRKLTDSKTARKVDVLPGSLQTQLYSIARTQSAESYRDTTSLAYKNKRWIKEFRWTLSSSHPRPDECDEKVAANPYTRDGDRPTTHDHCLCGWEAVPYTTEELVELLRAGKI